jgi:fructokinase
LVERESIQRLISVDLNLRQAIVGPIETWAESFDHFLAHAHIVKASLDDLQQAYGPVVDPHSVASQWLLRGVPLVLITLGANGAIAFYQGQVLTVPGVAVDVVDTVGAGDVFHAAFLSWFDARSRLSLLAMADWTQEEVSQAMHYAASLAARLCTVRGCDVRILVENPTPFP